MRVTTEAYIGLGSNVGDRMDNLKRALQALSDERGIWLMAASHVYESEPWGVSDQPSFLNAAARIRTTLPADELLRRLQGVERGMGREPGGERWGPRIIDLDILLYDDEEWASETLTIPHPRMGERDFVVRPLLEVAPRGLKYPDGRPVAKRGWLGRCIDDLGPVPGFGDVSPEGPESRGTTCDPQTVAPPGPEVPVDTGEWRTVGTTAGSGRLDTRGATLLFRQTVLEHVGIEYVYDPHPPSESFNPWGLASQIKLKVPAADYERAIRAIREAEEARDVEPR